VTDEKFIETARRIYATAETLRDFNADIVAQFRANGGRILSGPLAGAPLLLMTTNGPDGPELVPLAYVADGERLVVAASKGGSAEHPFWYHSLKADPIVELEVGAESYRARAIEVTGAERERRYEALVAELPIFRQYAARTTRVIPVFVLERIDPAGSSGRVASRDHRSKPAQCE
jgi:deazaflavin-dependent oxidoreductase (nitroreductase family)